VPVGTDPHEVGLNIEVDTLSAEKFSAD
jgi:hypothetical protein